MNSSSHCSSIFVFVMEVCGVCIFSMGLMQMTTSHNSGCITFSIKKFFTKGTDDDFSRPLY